MLKSIVNGAEHDIISIPMKGKNLAHANSDRTGSFLTWQKDKSTFTLNGSASAADSLPFSTLDLKAGTYTLSIHGLKEIGTGKTGLYLSGVDTVRVQTNRTYTITEDTTVTLRLVISVSDVSYDNEEITVMFNIGSTALPYEPYGYQNGWEVRDNQNRIIWGREDELQTTTGTLPFKGYDLPIKVKSLLGSAAQNGTPSPDSPIIPEMCGVRTENLFDETTATYGKYINSEGIETVSSTGETNHSDYIPVQGNTIYTISATKPYFNSIISSISWYDASKIFIIRSQYSVPGTNGRFSWSATSPDNAVFAIINFQRYPNFDGENDMVNVGSTALPYEPYGYKISFDNNGENLFDKSTITTGFAYMSGTSVNNSYYCSDFIPITAATYYFQNAVGGSYQNTVVVYDANKQGLRYEKLSGKDKVSGAITFQSGDAYIRVNCYYQTDVNTVMVNIGSTPLPYSPYLNETTPIYLGEVPTIRRIKKLVLDGTEDWVYMAGTTGINAYYRFKVGSVNSVVANAGEICTHYQMKTISTVASSTDIGFSIQNSTAYNGAFAAFRPYTISSESELTTWKSYLATQYQNGTPVTVWYILSEPETEIVNEPLAKIGDYVDELTTIKVHGLSAPLYGIGDYKDILNLSTGVVTRNIKKLVLTGTENWKKSTTRQGSFYFEIAYAIVGGFSMCDRATNASTLDNYTFGKVYMELTSYSSRFLNIWLFNSNISVDDFKAYLAAQYQNGTPVTVWYILAEPTTETVTVPTGMTGEIEGYLTQISTPTPEHQSIPKWNGEEEETGGTYAVTVYDLPEIETTTGKNTLTVDTTIAPYNVIVDGHIKYTYWGKIREDVRSGLAQTKFPVGTILYDNEDETTGRAFQVVGYDKHFDPSLTARGYNHSMTLCQLKLSGPWQFDATEAFLYTTVEMQPGTYKFKIPNYDTTYGGNKTYYFTSTASVPVDSQITLSWAYQQPPKTVTAYAGPNPQTNTTAITGFNALPLSEWIEGESPEAVDLGTIKLANNDPDSAYGKLNHIHRARYGSNNYYQSGLRQLLNTDLASNNWWHPTTIFDRPYANRTTNGYLRSLNEDFINVLATPEITHIANNIFEYPSLDGRTFTLNTEYKINTDKVFLLSHTEVGLSASPNIGTVLDYYSTHNTNNDRIKYRIDNGNAYYWWFRTPYPTYASLFRFCFTSGALSSGGAYNSYGVAPAHIIQ